MGTVRSAADAFTRLLQKVPGRPETGRWLRAMPARRLRDLLDPHLSSRSGGRVNPPGSFPVLYAVADVDGCRPTERDLSNGDGGTVIAVFSVLLSRVLDLSDPSIRRRLGVGLREIANAEEARVTQSIGVAAYNGGFDGIVYPRPMKSGCRNLAIFTDRISSENIRLLELRTPGFPAAPSRSGGR